VLWDADPRRAAALILARFSPQQLEYAVGIGDTWAARYDVLALGEPAPPSMPGRPPAIVVLWNKGQRYTA
jgi:hypothetical protein